MSLMNDDVLTARLREAVEDLTLPGPGPDLHRIRRRGSARRRRHQIALAGSTAAALALATSLVLAAAPGPDRLGFAGDSGHAAPADGRASDPAAVGEILDRVLDESGITDPTEHRSQPGSEVAPAVDPGTGQQTGWRRSWSVTDAQPKIVVSVAVYPEGWLAEQDYPCQQGNAATLRSCRDEVLSSGVRLLSGEDSSLGLVNDAGHWGMWSPAALAVYPDGRQVSISVGLRVDDGDQVSRAATFHDPGPATRISLDQLRAFVMHPDLTRISSPR